jgi:hypothetical protein
LTRNQILFQRNELDQVFNLTQNKDIAKTDLKTNSTNLYALIQKYFFIEKSINSKPVSSKSPKNSIF